LTNPGSPEEEIQTRDARKEQQQLYDSVLIDRGRLLVERLARNNDKMAQRRQTKASFFAVTQ